MDDVVDDADVAVEGDGQPMLWERDSEVAARRREQRPFISLAVLSIHALLVFV